ncbi:TolC family protein [Nannocystaceae bacterium ST9]
MSATRARIMKWLASSALASWVCLASSTLLAAPPPPELERPAERLGDSEAVDVEAGDVLTLAEVLASVAEHDPRLEAADQTIAGAEGRMLTARGGFDTRARVRGLVEPVGYYRNATLDVRVEQPTPLYGLTAWAGWRIGVGSFPVYDGKQLTASGGEVSAGVSLPLWRDGAIDRRRADIRQTKLERERLDRVRDARVLELEADAAAAYWTWVANGLRLDIEQTLLDLALERDAGLRRRIEVGAAKDIVGIDNRRTILAREARVVAAERSFQKAAFALSLYLRDGAGAPAVAGAERLPSELPGLPRPAIVDLDAEVEAALARRPDRRARLSSRGQADVELRLARNQRAPRIDLSSWVAQDLGVGPEYLQPFEWVAAIELEIPIPMRQARGRIQTADAELGRIDAELRLLDDQIAMEVLDAHSALTAAHQRASLAGEQVALAETLAEAEYRSFSLGASDLLLVNLRELASADAAAEHVQALADFFIAKAELEVAKGEGVQSVDP